MNSGVDDRRASILRAVIEAYINSAEPVGSVHVASLPGIEVSSATIRNEMSTLEAEGYLRQPHTSAGRIPTEKGYRKYVDELIPSVAVGPDRVDMVEGLFNKTHFEIEELLVSTSRLLTSITDCAAVVTGPSPQRTHILSIQLVGLGPRSVLLVAVDANGSIEKRTIDWPIETSAKHLVELSAILTSHFRNREVRDVEDTPHSSDADIEALIPNCMVAAKEAVRGAEREVVFIEGASRVVQSFDALDTIRGIISILERHYMVVSLMRSVLSRGQGVAIGSEHGLSSLRECAVVVAPYRVDGVAVGTVGLIGPTRMNYGSVIGIAQLVSDNLSKRLSEG